MTFAKFIETIRDREQIPAGLSIPRAGIRVRSAEGYVGRPGGLKPQRAPQFDEAEALDIEPDPDIPSTSADS